MTDTRSKSEDTDHHGDDGSARLRFPGGRLRAADWTVLAAIADEHGGDVLLTSRGDLQIPGARDQSLLRARIEAVGPGSRPGAAHPRARRIIASPLAGLLDGHHDLGDLPEQLDVASADRSEVASPSRDLLFGLDDGSGDVLAHSPDISAVAGPGGERLRLHVAGRDAGLDMTVTDAAGVLLDAAAEFAAHTEALDPDAESGGLHHHVVSALAEHPLTSTGMRDSDPDTTTAVEAPPVGWVDTSDGLVTLLAVVPLGVVPARLAEFLGAIERPSTVSADRVIGVHGLTEGMAEQVVRVLAPMGMIFDAASPWVAGNA